MYKSTFVYIFGDICGFLSHQELLSLVVLPPRPVSHTTSRQAWFYLRRQDAASSELYPVSAARC